jgi:hypothetical protein
MTTKTAFTDEEWKTILEGPMTAGMILITASGGGTFRETFALAHAYDDARKAHGASELLDAIAGEKPTFDRHRYSSADELRSKGLEQISAASALVRAKAPDDADGYRAFVLSVASKVAAAHKENGQAVSPQEQAALDEITARLPASG